MIYGGDEGVILLFASKTFRMITMEHLKCIVLLNKYAKSVKINDEKVKFNVLLQRKNLHNQGVRHLKKFIMRWHSIIETDELEGKRVDYNIFEVKCDIKDVICIVSDKYHGIASNFHKTNNYY